MHNKNSAFHWREHPLACDWSDFRKSASSSKSASESNERRRNAGENTSLPVGRKHVVLRDRWGGAHSKAVAA